MENKLLNFNEYEFINESEIQELINFEIETELNEKVSTEDKVRFSFLGILGTALVTLFFGIPGLIGLLEIFIFVGLGNLVIKLIKYLKNINKLKEKHSEANTKLEKQNLESKINQEESSVKLYLQSMKKSEQKVKEKSNKISDSEKSTKLEKNKKILEEYIIEQAKSDAHDSASKIWKNTYNEYCQKNNIDINGELNKEGKKIADSNYKTEFNKVYKDKYENYIKKLKNNDKII